MFELGLDYLAAGIYDRAEEMLLALQQDKQFSEACLRHLVELYESTHEWDKAIRVALKLLRYDASVGVVVAQLYCELAELQNESEQAEKFYLKARKYDPHCVRAALALGRMWYNQGLYRKAQTILVGILRSEERRVGKSVGLGGVCVVCVVGWC